MNYRVRPMVTADVDMVAEVEKQSFVVAWSRDAFQLEMEENELAHYFVAEAQGQVVGYAGMWIILDEAHITNVAVLPQYRGMGMGAALMAALMSFAVSQGVACMTLEVRQSNDVAKRLYESLGFAARGLRRQYYTDTQEDAVIMWLDDLEKHMDKKSAT